jgi:galactokinase
MIDAFQKQFGTAKDVRIFRAPGRVNLIGEHTDYNLGFVLPIALDLACFIACAPAADGCLHAHSEERRATVSWPVDAIGKLRPAKNWTDYIIGVAQGLLKAGFRITPEFMLIQSSVPEGSGLSSSAALEVSTALALLGDQRMNPVALAQLCQRAEIEFVGIPCGIMDQYVAVFGEKNAAIEIDCRSLEHEVVDLPGNVAIVAVNSMVKHDLAQSAYKERTEECATAVDAIRRHVPSVESLRDVSMEQFQSLADSMPKVIARRARHVISEIERVKLFVNAARRNDLERMGQLFVESHLSLQHDYEVSCAELDFLVDTAIGIEGVYGARMTGGGFGGCTVNLVRPDARGKFEEVIARTYNERFSMIPNIFLCRPSGGASEEKELEKNPPTRVLQG